MPIEPESGSLPQTGVSEVKTAFKSPLKGGTGNQHRDEVKFSLAKELVQAGRNPTQAMREAGYAESTARQSSRYPVKKALMKVRESYLQSYTKLIKKEKMDGASVIKRLAKVVHGNDDYNAIHAIRVHTNIILKNAPDADASPFFGVFVVPGSTNVENWQNEAKTVQTVQVENLIGTPQTVNP